MRTCLMSLLLLGLMACGAPNLRAPVPGGLGRPVDLNGRAALRVEIPAGYELQTERGKTFDVHHIWRVPPERFEKDTSLSIFVGEPTTAYCRPGIGSFEPAAFHAWQAQWHLCETEGTGRQVWETHLPAAAAVPLHLFIIGRDAGEFERLRAIAETLSVPGR